MDFVAGCIGGAAGCVASHPFDTVKVRLQCCKRNRSRSTLAGFRHILRTESLAGLYKGLASPLLSLTVVNAVSFGTYGLVLRNSDLNPDQLSSHFIAGSAAGLAMCPILCPVELIKTRMQMQGVSNNHGLALESHSGTAVVGRMYSGPVDCLRRICAVDGVAGLFRGIGGTVVREVPAIGIYFPSFMYLKQQYKRITGVERCPLWYLFISGGVAGCVSWAISYPADVIKTRLQADGLEKSRLGNPIFRYSGYADCIHKSVRTEGLAVLSRGLSTACVRAFPNNGVTLTVVTLCHSVYNHVLPGKCISNSFSNDTGSYL